MKALFRKLVSILLIAAVLIYGVIYITDLTKVKSTDVSDLSYKSYFECPDDYDVLFLGTSHVMYGIYPMELWEEYGITSYNWGSPSCMIPSVYWKLINLFEYATPKLVVVDCFRAVWADKAYNVERMHEAFDPFPLSINKIRAVEDLMDNEEKFSAGDRGEILFKLSSYHYRWEELTEQDFSNEIVDRKGAEFEVNVAIPRERFSTEKKTAVTQEMEGVHYLCKIIEECRERGIPVLLTYLPYPTQEKGKMESNMIQDIADQYGVNYINFTNEDIVDYDTDFSDSNSHLNPSGGKKVTEYLGEYIQKHYDIQNRKNEESYQSWKEKYREYVNYKTDLLEQQTELDRYLMLLQDDDFSKCIFIRGGSEVLNDVRIVKLIENISSKGILEKMQEAINLKEDYFMIDCGKGRIQECIGNEESKDIPSSFGNITYSVNDGKKSLYIGNNAENNILETEDGEIPDIQIAVISNQDGSLVNVSKFFYTISVSYSETEIEAKTITSH